MLKLASFEAFFHSRKKKNISHSWGFRGTFSNFFQGKRFTFTPSSFLVVQTLAVTRVRFKAKYNQNRLRQVLKKKARTEADDTY